jgi:hypothetical protein
VGVLVGGLLVGCCWWAGIRGQFEKYWGLGGITWNLQKIYRIIYLYKNLKIN